MLRAPRQPPRWSSSSTARSSSAAGRRCSSRAPAPRPSPRSCAAATALSLDLLERYGTDLLDALVALDKAGRRPPRHQALQPRRPGEPRRPHQAPGPLRLLADPGRGLRHLGRHPALPRPVPDRQARPLRLRRRAVRRRRGPLRDGHRHAPPSTATARQTPRSVTDEATDRAGDVRPGARRRCSPTSSARRSPATPARGTTPPRTCAPRGRRSSPVTRRPSPTSRTTSSPPPRPWRRRCASPG